MRDGCVFDDVVVGEGDRFGVRGGAGGERKGDDVRVDGSRRGQSVRGGGRLEWESVRDRGRCEEWIDVVDTVRSIE